jgi:hypothetical protein
MSIFALNMKYAIEEQNSDRNHSSSHEFKDNHIKLDRNKYRN